MASTTSIGNETKSMKRPLPVVNEEKEIAAMLLPSLYRLTEGLPRKELKIMVSEAMICEEALEKEIAQLQAALESPQDSDAGKKVQFMLDSEVTPPDRFFTVSALLGRLRDDLATPLPPYSTLPEIRAQSGFLPPPPKKRKKENNILGATSEMGGGINEPVGVISATLEKQKKVLSLYQNLEYTKEHPQPTALMALWKKISSHRSSIVFRRPVNPKEAPGYTDRIVFPMDLSLIRKMIVARQIKSYSELHQRLGLICHNCVKYNGRESDYGLVTRDFESNVDEMIVAAVLAAAQEARNPIPLPIVPQPIPSHSTMESKGAHIADAAPESLDGGSKANDSAPVTGIEQTTKKTVSALDAKERSRANEGTIEAPKTSTKASTESDGVEKGP